MLRYAVVGAGGYPGRHIVNIDCHGERLSCRLAAVTIRPRDRLPGQAEGFAARGVEVFADAVEMFDALAGEVEGVFIPTAIHTHCPLACAALARGYNVYLEKPPAATVQEVDRMLQAARAAGRMCALGFQAIYSDSIEFIKQRVVSGALGEVSRLRCWALWPRPDKYYARNEWAGQLKVRDAWVLDGPSNNALSHQIANLLYLIDPRPRAFARPGAVRAELYHARDIPSEDTSAIEIRTEGGARGYFLASHATEGAQTGPWIEMECSGGSVRWAAGRSEVAYADGRRESRADGTDPVVAALANFTEAVRSGDPSLLRCDLEMGRNFTLALNGAFESAKRVQPVPERFVHRVGTGPDARVTVQGINQVIERCGREGRLFADAGVDWAVATCPFDLTGYDRFPRQFAC